MASDVTTPTSPPHEQGPSRVGGLADEGTSVAGGDEAESTTSGGAEFDRVDEERRNNPQPPPGAMSKGSEEQTRGREEGGSEELKDDSVQVHVGKGCMNYTHACVQWHLTRG